MSRPPRFFRPGRLPLALVVALAAAACGQDATEPPTQRPVPVPAAVLVTPASVTMEAIGDTVRFTADVRDQTGQPMTRAQVNWLSDDRFVASVNVFGKATAAGNGTATITARVESVSGTAAVTVEQRVAAVTVSPDSSVLVVGEKLPLEAAILDANGHAVDGAPVAWASSDTAVAGVDETGRVTAVGLGRALIVAVSNDATAEVAVTVLTPPASVTIAPEAIEFAALGDTTSLSARALDSEGEEIAGLALAWSSADPSVATVDSLGRVVSVDNGTVDITAERASVAAVATVRIAQVATSLEVLPAIDTVAVGDSIALTALAADANGHPIAPRAAPPFQWLSSVPEVVAVDGGGRIAALAPGVTSVTASTGDLEATASLTVEPTAVFAKRVLTSFFYSTVGSNWARSDNWLSDMPLQDWYGLTVDDNGRITSLQLSRNGLAGSIPPRLGDLRALRTINLGNNALTGRLPKELANLDRLQRLVVNSNSLSGEIPTWLADMPALRSLVLQSNDFSGPIPRELARMPAIDSLQLGWNDFVGEIPPELGDLSTLTNLYLGGNELEGEIPPELGKLVNLRKLALRSNDLTGPIPPELGNLAELEELELYFNFLSGEIPPELGNLRNLTELGLSSNRLDGEIPPALGNLTNLDRFYLDRNQLTGPIPPELGGLASVELFHVVRNRLSGPLPPELGRLAALRDLYLSRNRGLQGPFPHELTALALDEIQLGGTALCLPADDAFRAWSRSIGGGWAPFCAVERTHAYLTQASQSASVPVTLVAGEPAFLRVFPVANSGVTASFPAVRARFFADGREVHSVSIPGSSRPLPTAINEGSLDASANARIPASVLVPGLEMTIEIDPEGALPSGTGVPGRWPEEGREALDVRVMRPLDLTLVPFLYTSNPNQTLVDRVQALEADDDLFRDTRDLLPVQEFNVTAREPVWTSIEPVASNGSALLRETWATRTMDGATGYYMGVMSGGGGRGYIGFPGSVAGLSAGTISHELGHNMSLRHAPCGDPPNVELIYPYLDGSVGSWGYDFLRGQAVSPTRPDLMSYCGPEWVSDYNFNKALRFRETLEAERTGSASGDVAADGEPLPGRAPAAPGRGLLLWGGQGADGVPILEPAFVVNAPPSLPREEGPFSLAGLTADEDTLFSFSFSMVETGQGDGQSAFAFVLPTQGAWVDVLDRIVLTGPGGSDTVGGVGPGPGRGQEPQGRASVLLVDGTTGRARGFLRDAPGRTPPVPGTTLRLPEPGLRALVSRGVPDSTAWRP